MLSGVETAVVVGGMGALGAAVYGMGMPKDSVVQYETAVKADNVLVMERVRRRTSLAPKRSSARSTSRASTCIPA